jgi:hypothetical protein
LKVKQPEIDESKITFVPYALVKSAFPSIALQAMVNYREKGDYLVKNINRDIKGEPIVAELFAKHKTFFSPLADKIDIWDSIQEKPRTKSIEERERIFKIELEALKEHSKLLEQDKSFKAYSTTLKQLTPKYRPKIKEAFKDVSKDTKLYFNLLTGFITPIEDAVGKKDKGAKFIMV